MVYIGNWILNSTRGDDRFEDYDLMQGLFALCRPTGCVRWCRCGTATFSPQGL